MSGKPAPKKSIAPPKGTRDLYPEDALRRRYVQQAWRDASIRCGFEEIAGPTFEQAELYAVKSGEGILGELFQAFSGKSPEEVEQVRESGRAPYALRPEFTPTLARMYAAKAGSLPRPCKWFTAGPYFRAERPQRGRLREFEQWNVDVIGLPGDEDTPEAKAQMDAECVECCVSAITQYGLSERAAEVHANDRLLIDEVLSEMDLAEASREGVFALLDRREKMPERAFQEAAEQLGFIHQHFDERMGVLANTLKVARSGAYVGAAGPRESARERLDQSPAKELALLARLCDETGLDGWLRFTPSIFRGLAYYTGTVFEVIAEGERAVAGGGRYDKLIELMGGPPTPAVGFAMGDVVLSLLLEDKGLMPEGPALADAVSRRPASARPDVFVVGADDEATDPVVRRLAADLRRGRAAKVWEDRGGKPWDADRHDPGSGGVQPLHARVSYKSTRNLKKLLADGEKQRARYAAVVHGEDRVELKDLDARRALTPADVPGMPDSAAEFSVDPASPIYVGRAVRVL